MSWEKLPLDFKVLVVIYRENRLGHPVYFSRLTELLKKEGTAKEIKEVVERETLLGAIETNWEKIDGLWTRLMYIPSDMVPWAKDISRYHSKKVKLRK